MPWRPPGPPRTNRWIFSNANRMASCATSRVSRLGHRLRPHSGLAFVFQPIALALDVDGMGVMQQAVEDGAGDHVVLENGAPFAVALVRRQDHGGPFIPLTD